MEILRSVEVVQVKAQKNRIANRSVKYQIFLDYRMKEALSGTKAKTEGNGTKVGKSSKR